MICSSCTKLSVLYFKKNCLRCGGEVVINIASLCESCSGTSKQCSVCLKKTEPIITKKVKGGCSSCGKK